MLTTAYSKRLAHESYLLHHFDTPWFPVLQWSKQAVEKQSATVAVLYTADYGFSDRLSQALARGITKTDTGVEMLDLGTVDVQVRQ